MSQWIQKSFPETADVRVQSAVPERKRIEWLDALRALAIVFVVLGHQLSEKGTPFFVLMSPVQMPLFFIVSGFLFAGKNRTVGQLVTYIFCRIFIPWLMLDLVWL